MTRVVDFDAARAERRREPVILRVGGREYTLSAGLPASVALDMIRWHAEHGDQYVIPYEELDSVGRRLFGSENWAQILDHGRLDLDELGDLVQRTVEALQAKDDGPPNRAVRRASRSRASAGSTTGR